MGLVDIDYRFVRVVVEGTIGPVAAGQAVRVELLDAGGTPIAGHVAWAGPARAERQLREETPEALRAEVASGRFVGGSGFQAVFASWPAEARSIAFAAAPSGAAQATPIRTTSRLPTPRSPAPSAE